MNATRTDESYFREVSELEEATTVLKSLARLFPIKNDGQRLSVLAFDSFIDDKSLTARCGNVIVSVVRNAGKRHEGLEQQLGFPGSKTVKPLLSLENADGRILIATSRPIFGSRAR